MHTPHIIVISGPSLSGKSELSKRLKELGAEELISITTRPKRINETDGESYNFTSKDLFEKLIAKKEIVQQSFLHNEYYGMSIKEINKKAFSDSPLIWVIAPQSINQIEDFIKLNKLNWKLTKCLIYNSPEILVERLIDRYSNENNPDKKHYAKRFINLINTEIKEWTSNEVQEKSDYIINNFSKETEIEAVIGLLKYMQQKNLNPIFTNHGLNTYTKKTNKLTKNNTI